MGLLGLHFPGLCIPVSYTHLDVYKRQVHTSEQLHHGSLESAPRAVRSRWQRSCRDSAKYRSDVYKRQVKGCLAIVDQVDDLFIGDLGYQTTGFQFFVQRLSLIHI